MLSGSPRPVRESRAARAARFPALALRRCWAWHSLGSWCTKDSRSAERGAACPQGRADRRCRLCCIIARRAANREGIEAMTKTGAPILRTTLKYGLGAVAVLFVAAAIFVVNVVWFRPWSLDLFYDKIFAQVLFDEPELLSAVGLVEQFGITGHNGKLGDESPAHQQRRFERAKHALADLHAYSLERQTASQRLSTHILEWYLAREIEGEKYQFHNYPVNQLFGVQSELPSFMANTHRLLDARDCEYYLQRLAGVPTK